MHKLTLILLLSLIVQTVMLKGIWKQWSPWTQCTVTCGKGRQTRRRQCIGVCPGRKEIGKWCTKMACPVNGNWGPWSIYGPCSVTCGEGVQERTRLCNDPTPVGDGEPCDGVDASSKSCNTETCAVNGNWGPWSIYGPCSVTCGEGVQERTRLCNDPTPVGDGEPCDGVDASSKVVTQKHVQTEFRKHLNKSVICSEVNGNWGPWSIYGPCSVTCGEGVQERTRLCNDPTPVGDGEPCDGVDASSKSCNTETCAAFTATLPGGVHFFQNGGFIGYPIKLLDNRGYSSGIFTVLPGLGGVYSVSVTMMSGYVTAHTTLRKNGAILVWLFTNNKYDMASQTINIQLVEGDRIWVQMTNQASSLFDVYNTFSAVRIR
ncbi:HMCN [Mytilus edulis]|uniref:HMCN n=1 Tax=Mytilus edulis TaxID=6550 RepID=A0A8S3SB10_MYTED|nr:HMCN [Mytilus edulis]